MSTSVLRRYTPPTCTLEIAAAGSALSRWTERTVLKNLRFHLSFDDPTMPASRQVRLSGDRTQLEALCEAVTHYVQNLLDPSAADFSPALRRLTPETPALLASSADADSTLAPASNLVPLTQAASFTESFPTSGRTALMTSEQNGGETASPAHIYLTPKGLLAHELHLGSLATETSGSVLRLSTVQLFDLANALDDYMTEVLLLPASERPAWMKPSGGWMRAAAVMVLALGATGGIVKFVADVAAPTSQSVASKSELSEPAPENLTITGDRPAGSALPSPIPSVPSQDLIPLPAPSAVGQTPATGFPSVGVPQQAPTTQRPAPIQGPVAAMPAQPRGVSPVPSGGQMPQAAAPADMSRRPMAQDPLPQIAAAPVPALESGEANEELSIARSANPEAAMADGATATLAMPAATPRSNASRIPQLSEVQAYFQSRWQPIENLTQTLEYRVLVAPDGTVRQVVPMGQVAGTYLDRTGMPLIGESLVSPLENEQDALFRIVFAANGQVQVFQEPLNIAQ